MYFCLSLFLKWRVFSFCEFIFKAFRLLLVIHKMRHERYFSSSSAINLEKVIANFHYTRNPSSLLFFKNLFASILLLRFSNNFDVITNSFLLSWIFLIYIVHISVYIHKKNLRKLVNCTFIRRVSIIYKFASSNMRLIKCASDKTLKTGNLFFCQRTFLFRGRREFY